jgi:hypothetical protein
VAENRIKNPVFVGTQSYGPGQEEEFAQAVKDYNADEKNAERKVDLKLLASKGYIEGFSTGKAAGEFTGVRSGDATLDADRTKTPNYSEDEEQPGPYGEETRYAETPNVVVGAVPGRPGRRVAIRSREAAEADTPEVIAPTGETAPAE